MPTHTLPLKSPSPPTRPLLEQNGNRAALLLYPPPNPSLLLFPTHLTHPINPRAYLSVPVSLPPLPSLSYDGSQITLSSPSHSLSLFLSPTHPLLHLSFQFPSPHHLPPPSSKILLRKSGLTVWRFERVANGHQLEVAIGVIRDIPSPLKELSSRQTLVSRWTNTLKISTPYSNLTHMLSFANIRLCEAVFAARRNGYLHSPGGGMFYSGVWTNDQAEYAVPVLALFGKEERQVAENSLRVLARHFETDKGIIPYSVEVDGGYIGALDRGDAAMFAWGGGLYILILGGRREVETEMFTYVKQCCEVLVKKVRLEGIVTSESDELEGRFKTGQSNLAVNCLAILALEGGGEVAREMGEDDLATEWETAGAKLRTQVERRFAVRDERIFAYYDGCQEGRGWACLTALARLAGGGEALQFVLREMWVNGKGLLVSSTSADVWDRQTLYAIRAAFKLGMVEEGLEKLVEFVEGKYRDQGAMPFAVENHESFAPLSAESGLLIRVINEGLLGMEFRAGRTMLLTPRCPAKWGGYSVERVFYLDACVDFRVRRTFAGIKLDVSADDVSVSIEVAQGTTIALYVAESCRAMQLTILPG
eukprot:GFKZ01005295.1.p1 GENE.GFKZ01005295.1~~GFKZ01005295.1.p1  ORF type:complete len:607 (+),score=72.27 GFKZ01005295.1:50-1822(+)